MSADPKYWVDGPPSGFFPNGFEEGLAEPEPARVRGEDDAEAHLRAIAYWRNTLGQKQVHAKTLIEQTQKWLEEVSGPIEHKIAWHEAGLRIFLFSTGTKTMRLVHGTIKRVAGRRRIDIADEGVFLAWAKQNDLLGMIRVKEEPAKKEIGLFIDSSGVVPPGVIADIGEDTFKVDVN